MQTNHGTNIKTEKYNPERIELIKTNLEQQQETGNPRWYEIQVDGMKVVSRTQDVSLFNNFELYIDDCTDKLKIMLFQASSMKYDTFNFICNDSNSLHGNLPTVINVEEKVHQALRDKELVDLKAQVLKLEEKLEEADEYHDILLDKIEVLESQKPDKGQKFVDFLMDYGASVMKNNPQALKGIPFVGQALAGNGEHLIVKENEQLRYEVTQLKNALEQLGYSLEQPTNTNVNTPPPSQTTFQQLNKEE